MHSLCHSGTGTQLAKAGFAVYGIDNEGHGKSSGLQGYIPSFDGIVNDCSDYFTSVCGKSRIFFIRYSNLFMYTHDK